MKPLANNTETTAYFRRLFCLSVLAFPLLSGWVAYDLHCWTTGQSTTPEFGAVLQWAHAMYGYWPTVLGVPFMGAVCCTTFAWRMWMGRDAAPTHGKARSETWPSMGA